MAYFEFFRFPFKIMSNPNPNNPNPFARMLEEQRARQRNIYQLLQSLQQRQQNLSNVVQNIQRTHDTVEQRLKSYDDNFRQSMGQLHASLDQVIQSTLLVSQQSRQGVDQQRARFEQFFNQLGIDLNNPETVRTLIQFLQQYINNPQQGDQQGDQQGGSGPSTSRGNRPDNS